MKRAMILLGNGYEEIEALTVVDYLRRAEIPIDMVSITGSLETLGDHQIQIKADRLFEEIDPSEYDAVITPGGGPGSKMLASHEGVLSVLKSFYEDGKIVASICASPIALNASGVAKHIKGTCYPGFESQVQFQSFSEQLVERDGNVITSRGPATAVYFALTIIEALAGKERAKKVENAILLPLVEASLKS